MDTSSAYHHSNMELSINTTKAYYSKKDLLNNLPVYSLGNRYLIQIFLNFISFPAFWTNFIAFTAIGLYWLHTSSLYRGRQRALSVLLYNTGHLAV